MENENISKILISYRRKHNLTQKELASMIGVSPKTISKWECGNGLPDVSLLDKISKTLDISIDDLLKGNIKKETKNKKYIALIIILLVMLLIIIILSKKNNNPSLKENNEYPCTAIGNYYIKLINDSNDENYKYITITMFQTEGVYTIKIPSSIASKLEANKRYKITFKTKENYQNVTPNILFNNSEIINVVESKEDEIWFKYNCDN